MSHSIEGEYGDGDCSVKIKAKNTREPYIILNLETYHGLNSSSGSHCDVVFITYCKNNNEFLIHTVELTANENMVNKKEIRKKLQNKFPNTLYLLKNNLLPNLGLNQTMRIKYCAVIAVPERVVDTIGSLIKRDSVLLGELKNFFNEAWITLCGENISTKNIPIPLKK